MLTAAPRTHEPVTTVTVDITHPLELIGSRVVIQGASGAGKTYALRRILEETHGRMQHLVLDVEDELYTLRERYDYVLIGGDGADAPITEETAGALAHMLLELGVSAILQLNDLGLAGQRRVIAAFISGLMSAPRALWHPVLVTLDEAHRYAPQAAPVASSEPLVNLATAGRKRGFGALFATQRLSQLSKDILGQCPNRIMGRVDQALDRRAAAEMLGFTPSSREAQALMRLHHEFWMVGPALAREPTLHRFSPAVTTHLQAGNRDVPSPPTPERLRAVLGRLAELATKDASENAKSKPVHPIMAVPDTKTIEAARESGRREGYNSGDAAGYHRGLEEGRRIGIQDAVRATDEALAELLEGADRLPGEAASASGLTPDETYGNSLDAQPVTAPAPQVAGDVIATRAAPVTIGNGHQRILDALAWFAAARLAEVSREQIGWAAGYRADTGHFGNLLSELAGEGLIDRPRAGFIALTEAGQARAAAPPKRKLTPEVLVERIKAKISGPAGKVIDCLVRAYPQALSREQIAGMTGYRADTGHFGNVLSELSGPEIATRPRPGMWRLADWVMLKGSPTQ